MSKSSIKYLVIAGAALVGITTGAAAISSFGGNDKIASQLVATRTETLNAENAPTEATSWAYGVDYQLGDATYTYNRVKAFSGGLCTLNYNGTITKDRANGLKSIKVVFTGSLTVKTQFEEGGEEMFYDLSSGVATTIYGNYLTIHSNAESNITSIDLEYDCLVPSSGMGEGVTKETVLSGDDRENHYSNGVVSYEKNTHRLGSFTKIGGDASFSLVSEPSLSEDEIYKFEAAAASWNDVVDVEEIKHTDKPGSNANIWKHDIQYVAFDLYLESGAYLSLYSQTNTGAAGGHLRDQIIANTNITEANSHIIVYDGNVPVTRVNSGKWYRVIVDVTNLATFGSNQYECVHITYAKGTFYMSKPELYHAHPMPIYLSVNKSSYKLVNNASLVTEFPSLYSGLATEENLDIDVYENGVIADGYAPSVESESKVAVSNGKLVAKSLRYGSGAETISYTKGDNAVSANVDVEVVGSAVEADGSRLAFYPGLAHAGTYDLYEGTVAGRTGVYRATGTGTYRDELDFPETARDASKNNSAEVMTAIKNSGVTHFALDICLAENSSARLQSLDANGNSAASHTNFLSVGSSYAAFNNGTFNASAKVFKNVDGTLTEIEQGGEVIQANVWYTVLFDYSFTKTWTTFSSAYSNASVIAPNGSVYIDNVRTLVA